MELTTVEILVDLQDKEHILLKVLPVGAMVMYGSEHYEVISFTIYGENDGDVSQTLQLLPVSDKGEDLGQPVITRNSTYNDIFLV